MAQTIILLGLLIFSAHLFSAIFSRKRIPDVLFLMIFGILVGPILHWVTPQDVSEVGPMLSSLTLLFILFDSGVDLSINTVRKYWTGVVEVTFASFFISMAAVTALGMTFGVEWQVAMLMGSMVSGTASAIVIPLVNQMHVSEKTRVTLTLESAISGVLCIVISLAFIEGYKMGDISLGRVLGKVLASFCMAVLLGVVGGILWSGLLEKVRKLQNSMFLTPAFLFVIYGLTELLGYSGAISALSFGLVMGNSRYFEFSLLKEISHRHTMQPLMQEEKSFFKEIVFILKTLFFVYLGICIPFTNYQAFLWGLAIAALLFVVRFVLIFFVGRNNAPLDRLTVSMMIPKGLVSAVLASMPEQVNVLAGHEVIPGATMLKHITYAVIFCSIVICSLLVLITHRRLLKPISETPSNTSSDTSSDSLSDTSSDTLSETPSESLSENTSKTDTDSNS